MSNLAIRIMNNYALWKSNYVETKSGAYFTRIKLSLKTNPLKITKKLIIMSF